MVMMMKAWRLDRLGGELRLEHVPMPEVRPGSILVRVEASTLMSYMKPYVEGKLPPYHAPEGGFTPGGNCVGVIEAVGRDVWQLAPGRRVLLSSLARSSENVPDAAQILIGVTSFGPDSERLQADWPDGSLAEYILLPASSVVPADGFEAMDAARLAAVRDRLPGSIVLLLLVSSIVTSLLIGREQGLSDGHEIVGTLCFILLVSLAVYVTLDLNQPNRGLIVVSQEPLERLVSSMTK